MKIPRSDHDERWKQLVQQAQRDTAPSVNLPALLRAVNAAAAASPPTWVAEFLSAFVFGRTIAVCLCGIGALPLLASWQVWDCWQTLAWSQWLVVSPGGLP